MQLFIRIGTLLGESHRMLRICIVVQASICIVAFSCEFKLSLIAVSKFVVTKLGASQKFYSFSYLESRESERTENNCVSTSSLMNGRSLAGKESTKLSLSRSDTLSLFDCTLVIV